MTLDSEGGTLSARITVGPVQKTFWSVSKRPPKAGGGFGDWISLAIFDDQSSGNVNQTVIVDDSANLIGFQIAVVFFVARVNFNQADPYRYEVEFFNSKKSPITGSRQAGNGLLDKTHILEQFDFVVVAA